MERQKILVIDDDLDIRIGLQARLKASGYETVFAEDCIGAMAKARQEQPDLILLDIGLPGGDGFVVLERLKGNTNLATIPVIVLSARDAERNAQRALDAGARLFLEKPAENDELLGAIESTLA